jgi:phenylacetate-CoA ligase
MSVLDRVYVLSPPAIQNAMVSGYGLILYWRRLASRKHRRAMERIAALEASTPKEVERVQRRLLKQTLVHAGHTVPHYRSLFSDRGVDPEEIDTIERLRDLPILEKHEVRENPERFLSENPRGHHTINTSGTTGSPLRVRCTRDALVQNYSHFYRLRQRLGVGPHERCATFAGRVIVEPARTEPPFWRHNLVTNTILYSTYHLSPDTLPAYLERLDRQQPVLIDSYPSALGVVASALRERSDLTIRPRAILTSSETLLPHQRAAAEEAFECNVTDQYGSAEMSAFIAQCERGAYHVWASFGIVEVLVDGRPARPRETGEIVTTGFINEAMPLIRYRTGDMAVMGEGCGCGLPFMVLDRIEGRMDDILVTPDGRRVGRLDPVFKGLPDDAFREVQIAQVSPDRVVVRYVPGTRYDPSSVTSVKRELAKRLGPEVRVEEERMTSLPRGASGKIRAVVGLRAAGSDPPGAE